MAKVSALAEPVLGPGSGDRLARAVDEIATPTGFAGVLAAARPAYGGAA